MFEAFCHFSDNHPEASFFQSAAHINLVNRWPEADWVLLLAVREEGMKDPGALRTGYAKTPFTASAFDPGEEDSPQVRARSIAGSLLAVIQHEPPPENPLLKPFNPLFRLLTSRTIIHGGPLIAPDTRLKQEMVLRLLLDGLQARVKKRSMFTQFRNSFDLDEMKPLFGEKGYNWQDRLNLLVDTTSAEKAWKGMTNNRRRQVRLSFENGATIINMPNSKQVGDFYEMLKVHYQTKVKKPLPGKAFFLALHHLSQPDNEREKYSRCSASHPVARFFMVAHNDKIIGGSACVLKNNQSMHEWYACGMDHEYKKQRIYPSVLSTWAAMEFAANNGIPVFDFMGLGRPEVPYGVRDFKKEFGGQWINPGRFNKTNRRILYTLSEIGYNVLYFLKR